MNTRSMSVKVLAIALMVIGLVSAANSAEAKVSPAIEQVVKLHDSGVTEDVMLAYAKGPEVPRPTAEEIIYLKDKGISKDVIMALLNKQPQAQENGSGRILTKPVYEQGQQERPAGQAQLPPAVEQTTPVKETVVYVQQPPAVTYVNPPVYFYDPWPRYYLGFGFGHSWGHHHHWGHRHHGHWGGHHGGGHHGGGSRGGSIGRAVIGGRR